MIESIIKTILKEESLDAAMDLANAYLDNRYITLQEFRFVHICLRLKISWEAQVLRKALAEIV